MKETSFTKALGIKYPIICGAMYPCSNPELVAAVSHAGGIGVVQPLSLVHGYNLSLEAGLARIRSLTGTHFGFNALIEQSSERYRAKMERWVIYALEQGCRFFVTALGNPRWVVDLVRPYGGLVYHDVVSLRWAQKGVDAGVDGLICVNNRAGGHAGSESAERLFEQLSPLGRPLVAAGGAGDEAEFVRLLRIGFVAVQMGTRFIATTECGARIDYKTAIIEADESDIVLTERVTGIPLSVIRTPHVDAVGTKVGPLSRLMFRAPLTKKMIRTWYMLRGFRAMRRAAFTPESTASYFQAGKSVAGVLKIEAAGNVVERFGQAWINASG